MILYRVLPLDPRAAADDPGGSLWWPRPVQGAGRHDNPDLYGCMYVSETPVSGVAEALAPFRSTGNLVPEMLLRAGRPLALATLSLDTEDAVIDLDDGAVLVGADLCPSRVATRDRAVTQAWARELHERRPSQPGLRWWSTLEAAWINVTLFDRAAPALSLVESCTLAIEDDVVEEAAGFLGLLGRE